MNLESVNKWLDEEYGCSYTRLEELHDFYFEKYTEQKEEINKLNEQLEKYGKYRDKEINRLNNIIDELERYISELLWYDNESDEYRIGTEILNKLNELKGDNK